MADRYGRISITLSAAAGAALMLMVMVEDVGVTPPQREEIQPPPPESALLENSPLSAPVVLPPPRYAPPPQAIATTAAPVPSPPSAPSPPPEISPAQVPQPEPQASPKPPQETVPEQVPPLPEEKPKQTAPTARPVPKPVNVAAIETAQETAQTETVIDRAAVAEGRVLLHLLAHGQGPDIEIAWPDGSGERERLYRVLTDCYGMRSALLVGGSALYTKGEPAGTPWALKNTQYSEFLRQAEGEIAPSERLSLDAIRRHHRLSGGVPVRVLPHAVDAGLVGALFRLADQKSGKPASITAQYQLKRTALVVTNVAVDGISQPGEIALSALSRGGSCP